nr:hypothetical protein [uncultured Duganella sp.]
MASFLVPVFSVAVAAADLSDFLSSSGVDEVALLPEPPPLLLPDELPELSPVAEAKVVTTWLEACCVGLTGSDAVGGDST